MANYIVRRIVYMILLLLVLSFVSFIIIQLPPGDYLSTMVDNLRNRGMTVDEEMILALKTRYGLDQPLMLQYLKWLGNTGFSRNPTPTTAARAITWLTAAANGACSARRV